MALPEPDLDEPGQPLQGWIQHDDGTRTPYPFPQTKRNNFQDVCTVMGGEENVTRKAVEAAGLDWREWGYFVVEMLEAQADLREHIASGAARIESATGRNVELPKMVKTKHGLLRLAEEPETAEPGGETPPPSEH